MRSHHMFMAICLAAGAASAACGQTEPVLIAASRMEAPGFPPGTVFLDFHPPSVGPDGRIAFTGRVSGSGEGVWVAAGGASGIEPLITDHPEWPGTPAGVRWIDFTSNPNTPVVGPRSISISARYERDGVPSQTALLAGGPGEFTPVLTLEDHPPETEPGVTFVRFGGTSSSDPRYRAAGDFLAVSAELAGPGVTAANDRGIWVRSPGGAFELAIREGDILPGGAPAAALTREPVLSGEGDLAFTCLTDGRQGLWVRRDGQFLLVLRGGDPAPGMPSDVLLDAISPFAVSRGGAIVARASLTGPTVTSGNDRALWTGQVGEPLSLIAREGDHVPGTGGEWTFGSFGSLHWHRPGVVTFWATLLNDAGAADRHGFWRYEDGALRPLMELQMPAPGLFGDAKIINVRSAASNVWGQMLLEVVLGGDGMSDTRALYAVARDDSLIPLVREGNEIEYAPGQLDVIRQLAISSHSGAGLAPDLVLNDRGDIAFHVQLELIEALYAMRIGCRADIDDSGALDAFDFLAFQDLFAGGDLRADLTGEGAFDFFDFLAFQSEFASACR